MTATKRLALSHDELGALVWLEYALHRVCIDQAVFNLVNGAPYVFLERLQQEIAAQGLTRVREWDTIDVDDLSGDISPWARSGVAHGDNTFKTYAQTGNLWGMIYRFQGRHGYVYDNRGAASINPFFRDVFASMWCVAGSVTGTSELVLECLDWRSREAIKMRQGYTTSYLLPPWHADLLFPSIRDHYVHVSPKDPQMVRFIETPAKGAKGTHMSMKGGRYLARYYPNADHKVIARYAASMAKSGKLQFATTAEDIERVYRKGPSSCMTHNRNDYSAEGHHPTEVYANSDIQIAFIEEGGVIIARAVCWPEKKLYGRIYGTHGNENRMANALKASGFNHGNMSGARVRRINLTNGRIVMPYIDGITTGSIKNGCEDYVMLGVGPATEYKVNNIFIQHTAGFAELNSRRCDCCEDVCTRGRLYGTRYYCEECANNVFWCDRMQSYYNTEETDSVRVVISFYQSNSVVEPNHVQIWACLGDFSSVAFNCAHVRAFVSREISTPHDVFVLPRTIRNYNSVSSLSVFRPEQWCTQAKNLHAVLASDGETWVDRNHVHVWNRVAREADAQLAQLNSPHAGG